MWRFQTASDIGFGVGWDMLVHGDPLSTALVGNLIGFGVCTACIGLRRVAGIWGRRLVGQFETL